MLATLVGAPFDDPDWLFEVKWDGFRVEAVVDGGSVRLWTRGEKDAAGYFGPFLDAPGWIDARRAVVDGEVIALDERGEPDFALLQSRIKGRGAAAEPTPFVYEVFDLLHLDGRVAARRAARGASPASPRTRSAPDSTRSPERARRIGWGSPSSSRLPVSATSRASWPRTVAPRTSRASGPTAGRRPRIRPEQELVVGGWVEGTGRAIELGALLVGVYEAGGLQYAGKVGAGFTNDVRAELLAAVAPLAATEQPFETPPPRAAARNAHWLRPELVIRAEFAGWTGDGLVRQAALKGVDLEKDPRKVIRERPKRSSA